MSGAADIDTRDSAPADREARPWLGLYREGQPEDVEPGCESLLDMWSDTVARCPDEDVLLHAESRISVAELDSVTDALAAALRSRGFAPGDRLAVFSQNDPAFVLTMLGAWKAGGTAVSVNPMYKGRELTHVLQDSGARALVCVEEVAHVVAAVMAAGEVVLDIVVTDVPVPALPGTLILDDLLAAHAGEKVELARPPELTDVAFLVYTSGTTGDPKGARLTHGNLVVNAQNYRTWMQLSPGDGILAVAPLFHITGLVGHAVLSLLLPGPLVLGGRFDASTMVELVRRHRPVFTVGAITALAAMAAVDGVGPADFTSLSKLYTGGAPVAPALAERLERVYGTYVHNAYGLTETASITHVVPPGERAPVDPESGALSIGVPVPSTYVRVLADDGTPAPPGEVGELAISGPQVASGYWERPDATAASFPGGELRTGDVGFMDVDGWFYLVDRKKDMIIASGYKVWPREVEDVLYTHPAVKEAAVVGAPDDYRGETVHAHVSLEVASTPSSEMAEELISWCRERLAAYKYPRAIFFVDELPKTASGKILRRELRDHGGPGADHGTDRTW